MSERSGGLASSAALMFSGTLASRVLGLVRNALLVAAIFSLGGAADAFSVANKLPNIIYMLIAGGVLNAVLVPQIVRAMRREDGGQEYVNRLLTLAGTVLLALTVLLTAGASLLVTLYATEFRGGAWAPVAVSFAYWCIPQLFFYGMYTLLGQVLNARSSFGPYMWAPVVNNLVAIAGLVAYLVIFGGFDPGSPVPASQWTGDRITLLAGTATLGVVTQALVLVIPLYRSGFRYRPTWGLRNSGLGSASRVALWAFAALGAGQVGYLAVSNLAAAASAAAEAGTGDLVAGNFAYDNAFLVFMLPQSLITVSLVTAMFTRLSGNAAAGELAKVRSDLSLGLRTLGVFTVFAGAALMVLAIPVIQVIQFDAADHAAYRAVGHVLVAMLIGLAPIAVWTMTQRVYFAFEDTRSLFLIQVPMALLVVLGCALSYVLLEPQWWVVGTGVATALSNTFGAVVSYLGLRRRLPSLDGARVLRTYLRLALAATPAALLGWGALHLWGVQTSFVGALVRVLVLGAFMALVYLVLLRRLHVAELDSLLDRARRLLSPLLRRSAPLLARVAVPHRMRTMWGTITGTATTEGATVAQGTPTALSAGVTLADRYRLLTELGSDLEASTAWDGEDDILQRPVRAVIVDGPRREEALDAARRAALIDDPRLVRVLRVGNHEGHGFVVTEPVTGPSLGELLRSGPLHPGQARALVGEAAGAVESARRRGVHHLRLRPSVLHRTPDGQVLLTGLALDAAQAGVEGGDPRAAARTDTVQLVELLYAALTGTWPGEPSRAGDLPLSPRTGDVPAPPGDVVAGVPHDLDTLCAVTFGPHDDGPFTPAELIRDLAPWDDVDPSRPADDVVRAAASGDGGATVVGAGAAPDARSGTTADDAAPSSDGPGGVGRDVIAAPDRVAPGPTLPLTPVRPLDTSRWSVRPPPADTRPPPFGSVLHQPGADDPTTGVLDTYGARHERVVSARIPTAADRLAARGGSLVQGMKDAAGAAGAAGSAVAGHGAGAAGAMGAGAAAGGATALALPDGSADGGRSADAPTVALDARDAETEAVDTPTLPVDAQASGAPAGEDPTTVAAAPAAGDPTTAGAAPAGRTGGAEAAAVAGTVGAALGTAAGAVAGYSQRAAVAGRGLYARAATSARDAAGRLNPPEHEFDTGLPTDDTPVDTTVASRPAVASAPSEQDEDAPERPRFNPTPIVIMLMLGLVVFALVLATNSLREAASSFTPPDPTADVSRATDAPPTTAPEPTAPPEPPPAEPVVPPAIASVQSLDPSSAEGENQDLAPRAVDGDPATTWNSLRYNNPRYGMKPGLGFAVVLAQPATVTTVTLDVRGAGGLVQIRATDPSTPDQGDVLAEGPMGPSVTYTLSAPTETQTVVLWFPELPVAESDGRNRIELAEITLG